MQSMVLPELQESGDAPAQYAGFWPRLAAAFGDGLVMAPLTMICAWAALQNTTVALVLWLPLNLLGVIYEIVFHAMRGQTLGKMLAGIRVTTLSGGPIGWRHALARGSVGIVMAVGTGTASLIAMSRLEPSRWSSGVFCVLQQTGPLEPAWGRWLAYATQVWAWSELFVLLLNKRKRALHDFIAGTVVVRDQR
jgi:uncharacterized RDD family membrane protein YckC